MPPDPAFQGTVRIGRWHPDGVGASVLLRATRKLSAAQRTFPAHQNPKKRLAMPTAVADMRMNRARWGAKDMSVGILTHAQIRIIKSPTVC